MVEQRAVALGLLGLSLLLPGVAPAQANGIKVGEGRVHPFFDLETRMDSAAGFFGNLELRSEAITHFRPGLRLELPSSSVALNTVGHVDYVYYTGLLAPGSQAASRLEADLQVDAAFNRGGTVEVDLADHVARSDRTTNTAIAVGIVSFMNELRAGVPIRPGGGALEVTPKAAWTFESFQSQSGLVAPGCSGPLCSPSSVLGMSYNNLRFELDSRWKFLPKTAVVLDTAFDLRSYQGAGNLSPMLLKAAAGLQGLISPKVAVVAKVGWGHDFMPSGSGAATVIGHLEVAYLMSETSNLRAGYLRTLDPVPVYGVFGNDRAYLDARFFFGGRLTLKGYAAFDLLSFYAASGRNDTSVTVDVGPEYQFTPWLIGALGYDLSSRSSSASGATLNFTRHEGYARVTFTY